MPIYEYQCLQCEKEFERLIMGSNSRAVDCPECGTTDVEKKFSVFAVKSGASFTSSVGGGGCGNCGSGNCGSCHH